MAKPQKNKISGILLAIKMASIFGINSRINTEDSSWRKAKIMWESPADDQRLSLKVHFL